MQQLVRGQLRRDTKQDWIRNARDLSVRAAVAKHHRGDAPGAVVALETGRALLLDESLDRTRLDLDALARDGHEEAARRYYVAARRWGDLLADTEPVSPADDTADAAAQARDDLDAAIDAIRDIGGRYANFASAPTIEDIVRASARDTIVYLSAAPPGGLAFIVRADGATAAIELPELTTAKLADVVGAWSAAYEERHDDRASWWRCVEQVTQWLWRVAMMLSMRPCRATNLSRLSRADYSACYRCMRRPTRTGRRSSTVDRCDTSPTRAPSPRRTTERPAPSEAQGCWRYRTPARAACRPCPSRRPKWTRPALAWWLGR